MKFSQWSLQFLNLRLLRMDHLCIIQTSILLGWISNSIRISTSHNPQRCCKSSISHPFHPSKQEREVRPTIRGKNICIINNWVKLSLHTIICSWDLNILLNTLRRNQINVKNNLQRHSYQWNQIVILREIIVRPSVPDTLFLTENLLFKAIYTKKT